MWMSEESFKFFLVRKKNKLLTVRMIKLQCKDNSETFFNAIKIMLCCDMAFRDVQECLS